MDNVNIKKMEVENSFTKCGINADVDSLGNCYGDDDGISCDACDNCDAPSSNE